MKNTNAEVHNGVGDILKKLNLGISVEDTKKLTDAVDNAIRETKINLLIVGATGSGKSTTIKALFKGDLEIPIREGGRPRTMEIESYKLSEDLTIYDSPGLGDGEKDKEHIEKIQELLKKKDNKGNALVDLVLIIVDGRAERDLATTYHTIKVISEAMKKKDRDRILIAINKCDQMSSHPKAQWDYENGVPNDFLKNQIEKKVQDIRYRILETSGLKTEPIYYSAGYYDEEEKKQYKPHNLDKIIATIFRIMKTKNPRKVLKMQKDINRKSIASSSNDGKKNYKEEAEKSSWDSFLDTVKEVAEIVLPMALPALGKIAVEAGKKVLGKIGEWLKF